MGYLRVAPANLMSLTRVLLAVAFLLAFRAESEIRAGSALLILVLAQVSDHLDGWIARRKGSVSVTGWVFDSYSDRAIYTAAALAFHREFDFSTITLWLFILQEMAYYAIRISIGDYRNYFPRFRRQVLAHAGLVRSWMVLGCVFPFFSANQYYSWTLEFSVMISTIYGFYILYDVIRIALAPSDKGQERMPQGDR